MGEKCPCETYVNSCCACVSMHCEECHGHSKFVQGRFCSNCGRPLKAELTERYVPKSKYDLAVAEREANVKGFTEALAKVKSDVAREIFEEIENFIPRFRVGYFSYASLTEGIAGLKKKYTEESKDVGQR